MFYNWSRLSGNCPLNIKDLCDIGWGLQSEINAIRRGAKKNEEIFLAKSKLNRLIKRFLGIISESNGNEKKNEEAMKADKIVEHDFREAYARILGNIDRKEEEMKTRANVIDAVAIPLYISEIESVLIGDVYDPIRIACEIYPKDKKMFIYKTFELVNKSAQIFGGETRFRPTKPRKSIEVGLPAEATPPITAEEMKAPEGQEKLSKKFDTTFGYDELKKADEELKRR